MVIDFVRDMPTRICKTKTGIVIIIYYYFLNIRDVSVAGLHFLGTSLIQEPRIPVCKFLLGSKCRYAWAR